MFFVLYYRQHLIVKKQNDLIKKHNEVVNVITKQQQKTVEAIKFRNKILKRCLFIDYYLVFGGIDPLYYVSYSTRIPSVEELSMIDHPLKMDKFLTKIEMENLSVLFN